MSNSPHTYTKYIKVITRPSFQLSASRERRLPARDLYLKGGGGGGGGGGGPTTR